MKLFFSRLDKSDSSSPPESPEINTEDILRSPTRKLEEGRKLDTLSVENKNKFKDMKDEIEAGMEARKKNLEEWKNWSVFGSNRQAASHVPIRR